MIGHVPAGDRPQDNLRRILLDGARLRDGERALDELIRSGRLPTPVGVIMIDLDSSAEVRQHGIEAKVELVLAARERVQLVLPQRSIVVDSGTRDETYIVVPSLPEQETHALAERVRTAVGGEPFQLCYQPKPIVVTASVGYFVSCSPRSGGELFTVVREAQHAAKASRDCVRTAHPQPQTRVVALPKTVVLAVEECGLTWDDAIRVGLQAVEEKYGGIWHWAVERRPGESSVPAVDVSGVDTAEAVFFGKLLASAVERRPASTLDMHEEHVVEVEVRLLPGQIAQLDKVGERRGIPVDALLREATQLAADRMAGSR